MHYLLIGYKSDSVDICRGCVVASYASDYVYYPDIDRDELVERWVQLIHKNEQLDVNEIGYAVQVYRDGILVWDEVAVTVEVPQ